MILLQLLLVLVLMAMLAVIGAVIVIGIYRLFTRGRA